VTGLLGQRLIAAHTVTRLGSFRKLSIQLSFSLSARLDQT
jgi:hypothetical protein